jgi:hypothetical protein
VANACISKQITGCGAIHIQNNPTFHNTPTRPTKIDQLLVGWGLVVSESMHIKRQTLMHLPCSSPLIFFTSVGCLAPANAQYLIVVEG